MGKFQRHPIAYWSQEVLLTGPLALLLIHPASCDMKILHVHWPCGDFFFCCYSLKMCPTVTCIVLCIINNLEWLKNCRTLCLTIHSSQGTSYALNPKDRTLKAWLAAWHSWNHVLDEDTMTLPLLSFSLLSRHHQGHSFLGHMFSIKTLPCHGPQGNRLRPLKPWRKETIPLSHWCSHTGI